MIAKRAKPEEIIAKLREVEVRLSQGESEGKAANSIGVHGVLGSSRLIQITEVQHLII